MEKDLISRMRAFKQLLDERGVPISEVPELAVTRDEVREVWGMLDSLYPARWQPARGDRINVLGMKCVIV